MPGDDAGSLQANTEPLAGAKGTLAINGVAKGINDPAETLHADGHVDDGTSPLDDIALDRELVKKSQCFESHLKARIVLHSRN